METPKHAWAMLVNWRPRSEHSAFRLIAIGALVVSAFHLHDRASKLEQRERLLERRIAAFSREREEKNQRAQSFLTVPAARNEVVEVSTSKSPLESTPYVDSVIRRAAY